ncbi:DUF3164 family protein [bacterium]|nr:DUF3164 family protein [bacterium]
MAKKTTAGEWLDARGKAIPPKYIKPIDKKRDALVERVVKRSLQAQKSLQKIKEQNFKDVMAFLFYEADTLGVKRKSKKGNLQFTNFSGDKRFDISVNDILEFDEQIHFAKELIDECLNDWSDGARHELKVIVDDVFDVDKKGKMDKEGILALRKHNFRDKRWKKAMELISDSVRVVGSRKYTKAQTRGTPEDEFKTINLNYSSI